MHRDVMGLAGHLRVHLFATHNRKKRNAFRDPTQGPVVVARTAAQAGTAAVHGQRRDDNPVRFSDRLGTQRPSGWLEQAEAAPSQVLRAGEFRPVELAVRTCQRQQHAYPCCVLVLQHPQRTGLGAGRYIRAGHLAFAGEPGEQRSDLLGLAGVRGIVHRPPCGEHRTAQRDFGSDDHPAIIAGAWLAPPIRWPV